jgi:hypothetical protein
MDIRENIKAGGYKADEDKVRTDLFPYDAYIAICQVLTVGAEKYTDRNWERGMKWSRPFSACMRHLAAWWQGHEPTSVNFAFGDTDLETGMSHLWHAGCCILFLIAYEARGMTEFDDRPQSYPKDAYDKYEAVGTQEELREQIYHVDAAICKFSEERRGHDRRSD